MGLLPEGYGGGGHQEGGAGRGGIVAAEEGGVGGPYGLRGGYIICGHAAPLVAYSFPILPGRVSRRMHDPLPRNEYMKAIVQCRGPRHRRARGRSWTPGAPLPRRGPLHVR